MQPGTESMTKLLEPYAAIAPDSGPANFASVPRDILDASNQECLILNLDAALRVHSRPHFFSWTQGLLQSLLRHELLLCALRGGEPLALIVDSFAMNAPDPAIFSETFLRDAPVAPGLVKAWEQRRYRPVVSAVGELGAIGAGMFARELARVDATHIVAHGMHDSQGALVSFFVFAGASGGDPVRQAYLAQLIVPFLHTAWMRARLNGRTRASDSPKPAKAGTITARELEILRWVYLGKSNFEIGAILNISPLTVKNHVQKILRKLDVVNRAQAVGKALDLRILTP